jgi:hypothetical protein
MHVLLHCQLAMNIILPAGAMTTNDCHGGSGLSRAELHSHPELATRFAIGTTRFHPVEAVDPSATDDQSRALNGPLRQATARSRTTGQAWGIHQGSLLGIIL